MDKSFKIAVILSAYDRMSTVINSSVSKSKAKLKGLQDGLNKFGNMATLGGGAGIGLFAGALRSAAAMEKMQVSLNTSFQGNEAAAKKAFETINVFAAKTPYGLEEVMTGFIKLKNMGLDPSQEALQAYGNTASSMGKSLDQMVEAVADAATGEFERLKEFGIKASSQKDKVTFTFQGVKTTVQKNSADIEGYLKNIGNTKFAGGIEAQSKTIDGQMSTLKDNFTMVSASIGKLFIPTINKLFRAVTPIIEKVQKWVDEHPGLVKGIAAATVVLFGLGIAAKVTAFAIGGITPIYRAYMVVSRLMAATTWTVTGAMKAAKIAMMSTGILLIIAAIATAAYLIYKNWDGIKAWFVRLWERVAAIFKKAWAWIKNMFLNYTPSGLIIKHWSGITAWFSNLWTKVTSVFSKTWEWIKKIFSNYTPQGLIYSHWEEIIQWFSNLWEKVTAIFKNAWKNIKNFFGFGEAEIGVEANKNINVSGGVSGMAPGLRPNPVSGNNTMTYAPVINFTGNAQDATALTGMMKNNFDKQMQEHQAQQKRRAF